MSDSTPHLLIRGIAAAKADSLWQLLVLQGAVGEDARAELLARVKEVGTRKRGLVTDDEFRELAGG